jgi:drug/metabolite transporter (DMT)-like permease
MLTGMPANRTLLVAAAAFLLGGLGNVAFSAHSGSVAGLLLLRFAFGAAAARGYLTWRTPPRPALRQVARARWALGVSAACEAGAVVLLMAAAQYVSTLTFTLIGLVGTAALALIGRVLGLGNATRPQAFAATSALLVAAAAVLTSGGTDGVHVAGVLLASASATLGVVASLTAAFAASVRHPGEIVAAMATWGCLWAVLLVLSGAELSITWSTVAAAAFIALLPGGVAKAMVYWSLARTAPYLVSACSSVALLSAGLGGWVLLGETPRLLTVGLSLVAASCVGLMSVLGRPGPKPPPASSTGLDGAIVSSSK